MRMSCPSLKRLLIQISSDLNALMPRYIIFKSVEGLCSISSRRHENNSIVATISQSNQTPSLLIHNCLKLFLRNVGSRVHCTPIAKHDWRRFAHFSQPSEVVLSVHLETDEQTLEFDALLNVEFGHEDHASCLNYKGWYLGHWEHSEPLGSEILLDAF